jgi:rRNA maturation endonuclease Nob1
MTGSGSKAYIYCQCASPVLMCRGCKSKLQENDESKLCGLEIKRITNDHVVVLAKP